MRCITNNTDSHSIELELINYASKQKGAKTVRYGLEIIFKHEWQNFHIVCKVSLN